MSVEEWITTREAAERLGVTTARIRQMVAENQIDARKLGSKYRGQWQINAGEVEERIHARGVTETMRVKNRMTPNPIVASPKTNYNQALRLMQQNEIKHLPIVDSHGKLVGIVTQGDMHRTEPSPVTTLSVFEMASLLEKVTMDKIMTSPVIAVDESCVITNAASFMLTNNVTCLPVVRDEKLVGIITDADIFKTFVEITGGTQSGSRIEARMPNQQGQLAPFIQALSNADSYIVSVAISYEESGNFGYVDVKERGGDEAKIRAALEEVDGVEVIAFRPSDHDKVLKFGK
jgi:acetoin utilization protein AcuB